MTLVKICGLTETDGLDAAVDAGVDFAGFVFCPTSPRALSADDAAELADALPDEVHKVGLFVDPTDAELDAVLNRFRLDAIQLHGAETPERVDAVRLEFGLPVIKAIGVATAADAPRTGGLGRPFPWNLMRTWSGEPPWMLAGGLSPDNVAEAIRASGAGAVDVSSGVESAPGVKDPARIAAFVKAAKNAGSGCW